MFAREGASAIVHGVHGDPIAAVVQEIQETGGVAIAYRTAQVYAFLASGRAGDVTGAVIPARPEYSAACSSSRSVLADASPT